MKDAFPHKKEIKGQTQLQGNRLKDYVSKGTECCTPLKIV